jgi:heme o synthase
MIHYLRLIKYILSAAIALSACVGYSLSYNSVLNFNINLIICFTGVFLLSAGASVLNQYIERNTDSLMERTAGRPIPSGAISPGQALAYSIILSFAGALILLYLSIWAMILGIVNLIIYNFVYTPLKYKSSFCLLPGGLVGGIPPLIGWFAAGENSLSMGIIYFSFFMFLWQIPHFIILNIKYIEQYQKAGIITLASVFNISKAKNIVFSWLFSAGIISCFFPYAGIINSKLHTIILVLINIVIIPLFTYLVYKNKKQILPQANMLIHIYLISLFILVLGGRI